MKVKRDITIRILAVIVILAYLFFLRFLSSIQVGRSTEERTPRAVNEQAAKNVVITSAAAKAVNANTGKNAPPYQETSPPRSIDKLLDEMVFGAIAFNAPVNINIDDSPQIELFLSLTEAVENLKQSITEEGDKVGATIKVSDRMSARLSGNGFKIITITPEIQAVSKYQQTKWKWEIHPKKEGRHKLHLTLAVLLEINGYNTPRAIKTFDKIIEVNVTVPQRIGFFFKNSWQWVWGVILIPVVRWFWKLKKGRTKNGIIPK